MKKISILLLALVLVLTLVTACGETAPTAPTPAAPTEEKTEANVPAEGEAPLATAEKTFKVGLVQLVEHPSLDEIRLSFIEELEKKAAEEDINLTIDYKNAQGDISIINSICRNFVEDKVDVMVAIATPTAQGAASISKDIPIIFSAVTDPIAAGLLDDLAKPSGNITGTSDAIPVDQIFKLAKELTPEIKEIGLIYNKGESNSVAVIEETKAFLDANGYTYTEKIVANSGEVQQASRVLVETSDAIFAPIDNTVATAMGVLASEAIKGDVPVYVAADSMVADGGLATVGVNYTLLGKETADMALKVLQGTPVSELPVRVMENPQVVVNQETAAALGVDVSKYTK